MIIVVHAFVVGPFQENTFLITDPASGQGIFIDPGDEARRLIEFTEQNKICPLAIVNTHAHLDHIGAVKALKEQFNIPFYLHHEEQPALAGYSHSCAMFGLPVQPVPTVDHWLANTDELGIGPFKLNYLKTPGHTPGGICIWVENHVFVGDTLFNGSVGRTDLPGGSWSTLEDSLVELFGRLTDSDIIYSGHGPTTNRQTELSGNPFILQLRSRIA